MLIGDVFDRLTEIPDRSVDLILTSPPFLALRSYLPDNHPHKNLELGSEPDPASWLDMMLRLTAEWRRVLAPHGTLAVELGDTYSSVDGAGWPLAKSLTMIPELYRVALAYGRHPLTGQPSPGGAWRVRNVVRWVRPNPPVSALGDKFRPATSDMVIACTSKTRWFDLTAVRTEPATNLPPAQGNNTKGADGHTMRFQERINSHPAGAPPLDWWKINPGGYNGSHYAVYPEELCRIPILAMCPRHVCQDCGEPRRRIERVDGMVGHNGKPVERRRWTNGIPEGKSALSNKTAFGTTVITTLGWTDCGHNNYRPGLVLDPFLGSGTTAIVATGNGRNCIGIDIDARNAGLAQERIGMFLDVINHGTPYQAVTT